jgi:alpha-acetolactate decarboxylase
MKNLQILLVKQNTFKAFFHIQIVFDDFKQHHVNEYSMFKTMSKIEVGMKLKMKLPRLCIVKDMDSLDSIADFEN